MKLYGMTELAAACGVGISAVCNWRDRGQLPKPSCELAVGPVWSARRIEPWIERYRAGGLRATRAKP